MYKLDNDLKKFGENMTIPSTSKTSNENLDSRNLLQKKEVENEASKISWFKNIPHSIKMIWLILNVLTLHFFMLHNSFQLFSMIVLKINSLKKLQYIQNND